VVATDQPSDQGETTISFSQDIPDHRKIAKKVAFAAKQVVHEGHVLGQPCEVTPTDIADHRKIAKQTPLAAKQITRKWQTFCRTCQEVSGQRQITEQIGVTAEEIADHRNAPHRTDAVATEHVADHGQPVEKRGVATDQIIDDGKASTLVRKIGNG